MKPVIVTLKKGRHKSQPWTFVINGPGNAPNTTNDERYADRRGAKRGALRFLDARTWPSLISGREWFFNGSYKWVTPKGREIKFVG